MKLVMAGLAGSRGDPPTPPTTAERRNALFMKEAKTGCCRWDGMSWPFSPSQTLYAMANLSKNSEDWVAVDFGSPRSVSEVLLHIYDDGGGVLAPISYSVDYWNGTSWTPVTNAQKTPATPVGRRPNRETFDTVSTSQIRVHFVLRPGAGAGLSELEVWAP